MFTHTARMGLYCGAMSAVIGFHVVCCSYGFWLPNEERGSCSDHVRSPALQAFGPATTVDHRRSVAHKPFDWHVRQMQLDALRYPPVKFNDAQVAAIGRGI